MSGKKYSFSKEIAESLGITEAIILDFFQNNRENFSLSILKDEFRFLNVSEIENSYQKLDNLGLFNNIPAYEASFLEERLFEKLGKYRCLRWKYSKYQTRSTKDQK